MGSDMTVTSERIKKYRRWFGWALAASLPLAIGFGWWIPDLLDSLRAFPPPPWYKDPPMLLAIGSLLTACTALMGFLITSFITWRKDRRESDHSTIELEKKKLELEQLRREIRDKNAAAQEKRKKTSKRRRVL
jgi:hypothetical protein